MLTLAAVHLSPWITVPIAVVLAVLAVLQLSRPVASDAPRSRTRIRRLSMLVRIALLVPLVIGLSFADPEAAPLRYVWSWAIGMVLLSISLMVTAIDMANNLRVRAIAQEELAFQVLSQAVGPEAAAQVRDGDPTSRPGA